MDIGAAVSKAKRFLRVIIPVALSIDMVCGIRQNCNSSQYEVTSSICFGFAGPQHHHYHKTRAG
jgi:hypothetical protein